MGYKRKAKDFVCTDCGKDFDKESKLKRHYKDAHKKELVYPIGVLMPSLSLNKEN
jgi:transposase-like protein